MAKKYKSFVKDYDDFLDSLEKNPFQGTFLGMGVYKTRMAIASKGKGKSGGARVLTYNVTSFVANMPKDVLQMASEYAIKESRAGRGIPHAQAMEMIKAKRGWK